MYACSPKSQTNVIENKLTRRNWRVSLFSITLDRNICLYTGFYNSDGAGLRNICLYTGFYNSDGAG